MAKCKRNRNRTKRSFTVKEPKANRNYKDTVFRMLFSDRKNLLSLYNAVNQTDYKNPEELEIVTLENAIYMGMKNDLAFIMDTNLYLYEHQSTYNPNMPLRDLFYICSEYQKLVDKKSLFSSTLQKIPAPNFIEFYFLTGRICSHFTMRSIKVILSSFTMVQLRYLTVQSFGFPQHLNICQVNQSSN